jgi:hypothetical protein
MNPSPERRTERPSPPLVSYSTLVLLALALATLVEIAFSLRWRMEHDTPLLNYAAWLMLHGAVPYRDVFETSMPGSFLFHILVGSTVGFGDRGFQFVDVLSLIVLGTATWRLLRTFGTSVALSAFFFFALSYLRFGPFMTLQRDYLGLILVVIAAAIAVEPPPTHGWRSFTAIGLIFGMAMLIKPQLVLGAIPITLYLIWQRRIRSPQLSWTAAATPIVLVIAATAAIPVLIALAVLWHLGALPIFIELVTKYLPLHIHLSGVHVHIEGMARLRYIALHILILGHLWAWLPMAFLGIFLALRFTRHSPQPRAVLLLLFGLTAVFLIYPALSGQFWSYHWIPFQFFLTVLAALGLLALSVDQLSHWRWLALGLFLFTAVLAIVPDKETRRDYFGKTVTAPKHGNVDRIAALLEHNMRPGDTVQPLDWTEGSIHAMLLARVRIATPFMYDYHFYHDVDNPEIIRLRHRFMDDLYQSNPRFIIYMKDDWPRVSGPGTSTQFPQLSQFIAAHYVVRVDDPDFAFLERACSTPSNDPAVLAAAPPCDHSTTICVRKDCFGNMRSRPSPKP